VKQQFKQVGHFGLLGRLFLQRILHALVKELLAGFPQAAPLLQQALTMAERSLGSDDSYLGVILNNLTLLSQNQGRYQEAEPLLQRALAIYEQALGPDHPYTATTMENYASLLRELNRPQPTNCATRLKKVAVE
jgi:tetratricopeptide (TPR) repeat protein